MINPVLLLSGTIIFALTQPFDATFSSPFPDWDFDFIIDFPFIRTVHLITLDYCRFFDVILWFWTKGKEKVRKHKVEEKELRGSIFRWLNLEKKSAELMNFCLLGSSLIFLTSFENLILHWWISWINAQGVNKEIPLWGR